ncbi:MAG: hypothetical protein M1319_05215, partial [Chloroflexi bacterium]|nr:hypothetical protein [Chloroflexota bacterium]
GPLATRELLLKMAGDHEPLKPRSSTLGKQFNSIYSRSFLAPRSYEGSNEDIYEEISGHWERFVKEELPVIVPLVLEHVPGQDQGLDDYAGRGGP